MTPPAELLQNIMKAIQRLYSWPFETQHLWHFYQLRVFFVPFQPINYYDLMIDLGLCICESTSILF